MYTKEELRLIAILRKVGFVKSSAANVVMWFRQWQ
jgi:hypothetical protein